MFLTEASFDELAALAAKHRFHVEGEVESTKLWSSKGPHMQGRLAVEGTVHWDGVRRPLRRSLNGFSSEHDTLVDDFTRHPDMVHGVEHGFRLFG